MDVETALREIDEANAKHVGAGEEYEAIREEYERVFDEVDRIADGEGVEELLRHIDQHIRYHESRPSNVIVTNYAVAACREVGEGVPEESWIALE